MNVQKNLSTANFFPSKYPIICSAMNGVYSYEMLVSCVNAGIMPAVFSNMIPSGDLDKFLAKYGPDSIIINSNWHMFLKDNSIVRKILNAEIKFLEITVTWDTFIPQPNNEMQDVLKKIFVMMKNKGCKLIFKMDSIYKELADVMEIKGNEAAGRSLGNSLMEEFESAKAKFPNLHIIASGGIYSSDQVKYYIDNGAVAISAGTIFASSTESPLSPDAKMKIINSTSNDLSRFEGNNQQGLIFSRLDNDNENNSNSLEMGIRTGSSGHIFAGMGLDSIHSIRPIKEIVADLVKFI